MVESLANVLHTTDNDNEDTIIKTENPTSQSTQMLHQMMQQKQQIHIIMSQLQTHLNNPNKNGGHYNNTSGGKKRNKAPFWKKRYWWTHGACNHQGSNCRTKSEDHIDNVTLNKQLNGRNCNFRHIDKNNNAWRCGIDSRGIDKYKNKPLSLPINFTSVVPPIMKTVLAKANSGSPQHYLRNEDKGVLIHMKPATNHF